MDVQEVVQHPIQQALAEGRAVFTVRGGEIQPFRSYHDDLASQWQAALNGYAVPNYRLSEAYGVSATANAAANYRADKASLIPLKVQDTKQNDLGDTTPAQWFIENKTRILWHIEMSLELWGVAYLIKRRDQGPFPTGIEWVPTDWVQPQRNLTTGAFESFFIRDVAGYTSEYKAVDVIRIDTFDPHMGDYGKSHFEISMGRITTEKGLIQFAASFFLNAARPDGMLISKSRQSPEQMKEAEQRWKSFKGSQNAFSTFVSSGEWEWVPITPPLIDLEMGTLGDSVASDICRVFQVNPVLIGAGQAADPLSAQSTFRSIERSHVEGVTIPRVEYILGELNRQWLWVDFPQKRLFTLVINRSAMRILSDINEEVAKAGQTGLIAGILDYDEAREHAGLQPRQGYYMARNPADALSVWNGGGVFLDELRAMIGLPPLPNQQGLVILVGGQLIPVEALRTKAQQNMTPAPAPQPLPQPQTALSLSDVERVVRMALTDMQARMTPERAAPAPVMPGMDALLTEIRSLVSLVRDVMPIEPLPSTPVVVPVEVTAPLPNHAFIVYIQRQLSQALTDAGILEAQWSDPNAWAMPLFAANVPAVQAASLLRRVEMDEQFAFDVATARLDWNRNAPASEPIVVSLMLEGRGLQQLFSSLTLMAQSANVLSQATYPAALPLVMLPRSTDTAALEEALSQPVMAYALSISKISARAGDTPPVVWQLDSFSPEQAAEFRVWRSKVEKKGRGVEFELRSLKGHRPSAWVQLALRMGLDTKAVFETAMKWSRAALTLEDKDADGVPDLYESYWHNYDTLQADIGAEWLNTYMASAWEAIAPRVSANLSESDVGEALRANHDTLAKQWVGDDPANPGVLTKLILAGMAAGQQSLIDNAPADYRAAFRAIDVTVAWDMMSVDAYKFAQSYSYDLIKGIDTTTRSKVASIMTQWIANGGSLDDLTAQMQTVFTDTKRATLIANTESIRAYNEGAHERWRQAGVTEAIWHTVRDSHVCTYCAPMHGTRAAFDVGWTHPGGIMTGLDGLPIDTSALKGQILGQPAHTGCRCFGRPVVSDAMAVVPPTPKPFMTPGSGPFTKPTPSQPPPAVQTIEQPLVTDYADLTKMSRDQTRAWGVKEYQSVFDALSPDQREAVRVYTTEAYSSINGRLRGRGWAKDDASYDDTIKIIDTAFANAASKTPLNIITYRGIDGWKEEYDRYFNDAYAPASVFEDKGYFSTSMAYEVGQNFGGGSYPVVFRIFVRKDLPSLYCGFDYKDTPDGFRFAFPHECEVLLPRSQRLRIVNIAKPAKYGAPIQVDLVALFNNETRKGKAIMSDPKTPNTPAPKPEGDYKPDSKFSDWEPGDWTWLEVTGTDATPAQRSEGDEEEGTDA